MKRREQGKLEARNRKSERNAGGLTALAGLRISNLAFRISSPSRSGWALIELLVVTSMTLLIAGSACMLMSKMLRSGRAQADSLVRQRTLHRWEDQFRQDGRLAQSATVVAQPPDKVNISFHLPNAAVTYLVIPGGLERRVDGELGGRWECGSGEWAFTLLDGVRIVRAEYRREAVMSQSSTGKLPTGAPAIPQWTCNRVDVALGLNSKGDQ